MSWLSVKSSAVAEELRAKPSKGEETEQESDEKDCKVAARWHGKCRAGGE